MKHFTTSQYSDSIETLLEGDNRTACLPDDEARFITSATEFVCWDDDDEDDEDGDYDYFDDDDDEDDDDDAIDDGFFDDDDDDDAEDDFEFEDDDNEDDGE